jgi:hypothetical protein
MLRIVSARTFNLILLNVAARAKHGEMVACQSSEVQRSTGAPLFFRALRERPNREVSDEEFAFGRRVFNPSICYPWGKGDMLL